MLVRLLGIKPIEFTNDNGERISGNTIFCAFKDETVDGLRTEKWFLKEAVKLPECKINDNLEISFNMKGKVEMVTKA